MRISSLRALINASGFRLNDAGILSTILAQNLRKRPLGVFYHDVGASARPKLNAFAKFLPLDKSTPHHRTRSNSVHARFGALPRWLTLQHIVELAHPEIHCTIATINRSEKVWCIEPSRLAEIEFPQKLKKIVMLKKKKNIFFKWFCKAFGKSRPMYFEDLM